MIQLWASVKAHCPEVAMARLEEGPFSFKCDVLDSLS
jgi:hypothetical protein